MTNLEAFPLGFWDYLAFILFFAAFCFIGFWSGRKKHKITEDLFLAGRSLPWYVVGGSFVAATLSTEHFIGLVGAAFIYGICVATCFWNHIQLMTYMIFIFVPFFINAKIFTTPEFLEHCFSPLLRNVFAIVTIISNVVAFLAAILYGSGLVLRKLFGWNMWVSILCFSSIAATLAIYGGMKSVAWTDLFITIIMLIGGIIVTILGLYMLAGDEGSISAGIKYMIEKNQARDGIWAEAVAKIGQQVIGRTDYNRLAIIQPLSHDTTPWLGLITGSLTIGVWFNACNQFMIQKVLSAKNIYHARMGLVSVGFMFAFMPILVVIPGLILFAKYPEILMQSWNQVRPMADRGYIHMLQTIMPVGLRGLFLVSLFGAIQSTINAVLNSIATVFTLDVYKRLIRPQASETQTVRVGAWATIIIAILSILMAGVISTLKGSLFVYMQTMYAFFAPPFSAVFLLGMVWRRINGKGATAGVFLGFVLGILIKLYVQVYANHPAWLEPYSMQATINWASSMIACITVSLCTAPPRPEQVTDQLTLNWKKLTIFNGMGGAHWYTSVWLWWGLFFLTTLSIILLFSGIFL